MPWKTEKQNIPNNKCLAEKRLPYLRKKLKSNAKLHNKYTAAIQDYLESGYFKPLAVQAPDLPTGAWYIPHY